MIKKLATKLMNAKLRSYKDYHQVLIQSLQDPEEASAYLKLALQEYQIDGHIKILLLSLRNVAEASGGLANLAKKTHLNRQSLYRILSKSGNPTIDTFGIILNGLGYHLSIERAELKKSKKIIKVRKLG
jgi:probable addiction module antidote protein